MTMSETVEEYISNQDRGYERRYKRLMASPEAKARLIGDSWGYYYSKCLDVVKPATRYIYARYFLEFLIWLDKTSDQLYEDYFKMVNADDPRKDNQMTQIVSKFQDWYVETRGITYACADNIYCAVKGFFKANKLNFEYFARSKWEPKPIPYMTKEQILKVFDVTGSPKVKSYLTFAKDSGLRISDLVALRIRKMRSVLDTPSIQYHTFEIKVIKTGFMANPVIGPDAIKYFRAWMIYRVNILGLSAKDDDFVFCSERNQRGHTTKNGFEIKEVVKGSLLDSSCLSTNFSRLVKKAGLKPAPGEDKIPTIHSTIKFFTTNLLDGGCPEAWVNRYKGRKGVGTLGVYVRPSPERLIERYRLAYPALSLSETVQDNEMQELRQRLAEVQQELAQVTEIPEFATIMDRLDSMQNQIDNMSRG